jgi:glycosyltransferase involved in cell wall biosynthesis
VPVVSVIVPTYNGERYVGQTIDSVLAQTFEDWELLVVDDGSKDGTASIVSRYAARDRRIRLLRRANGGEAEARNLGIEAMSRAASYAVFLDHDDVWESTALEVLIDSLTRDPHALAAYGLAKFIDEHGNAVKIGEAEATGCHRRALVGGRPVDWPPDRPTTFSVLILTNRIWTPGQVLIRRQTLEIVGRFDPDAGMLADLDYWLRLTLAGDVRLVRRVVIQYRLHPDAQSHRAAKVWSKLPDVYRKLMVSGQISGEQRELIQLGYRWRHRENASLWLKVAGQSIRRGAWVRAANSIRHAVMEEAAFHLVRL